MTTATPDVEHQQSEATAEKPGLVVRGPELPEPVVRRGITEAKWRMLFNLYPGARADSALMVWDYCQARKLDPMKKPCHIVPMDVKDAQGNWTKRDVVMPGIYEYRITAHRTGTYLGHSKPEFGPVTKCAGVDAPESCEMTFYRWHEETKSRLEFSVTVFFSEVVATNRDGNANARWTKAPRQMLVKCTEAAGLREGWPEEFGGEPTAEEMEGQRAIDVATTITIPEPVRRSEKPAAESASEPVTGTVVSEPEAGDELTNELPAEREPERPSTTTTKAAPPKPTAARPTGKAPDTRKPDSKSQPGNAPSVTTESMVITDTAYIAKPDEDPFYEVKATVTKPGQAPVGMIFVTRDKSLYDLAASCEGTGQLFHIAWHGSRRQDGSPCKVLESIAASN